MLTSFFSGLTGLSSNSTYISAIGNNLANVNTVGFKPDMVFNQQRLPARLEGAYPDVSPQWLLEKLGGGNFVSPTHVNLIQGSLEATERALDVAIQGDGFFVLGGEGNEPGTRLTRDGRFELDANNQLVLATSGQPVLDINNQPITLDTSGAVHIDGDGVIRQDGDVISQLRVVQPTDPTAIVKIGHNMVALQPGADESQLVPATGRLHQGHVERSAADPIATLNQLIAATKAVQGNAKMMQYHDNLMEQAVGTFGRVNRSS